MILKVKEVFKKILNSLPRIYTTTYNVPTLSAGAKGYWQIPISVSGNVLSVRLETATINPTGGLQVTPIYADATRLFVNYYAPTAITNTSIVLTVTIIYNLGGVIHNFFNMLIPERGWAVC